MLTVPTVARELNTRNPQRLVMVNITIPLLTNFVNKNMKITMFISPGMLDRFNNDNDIAGGANKSDLYFIQVLLDTRQWNVTCETSGSMTAKKNKRPIFK